MFPPYATHNPDGSIVPFNPAWVSNHRLVNRELGTRSTRWAIDIRLATDVELLPLDPKYPLTALCCLLYTQSKSGKGSWIILQGPNGISRWNDHDFEHLVSLVRPANWTMFEKRLNAYRLQYRRDSNDQLLYSAPDGVFR
jgi:hypothetical protein